MPSGILLNKPLILAGSVKVLFSHMCRQRALARLIQRPQGLIARHAIGLTWLTELIACSTVIRRSCILLVIDSASWQSNSAG